VITLVKIYLIPATVKTLLTVVRYVSIVPFIISDFCASKPSKEHTALANIIIPINIIIVIIYLEW